MFTTGPRGHRAGWKIQERRYRQNQRNFAQFLGDLWMTGREQGGRDGRGGRGGRRGHQYGRPRR